MVEHRHTAVDGTLDRLCGIGPGHLLRRQDHTVDDVHDTVACVDVGRDDTCVLDVEAAFGLADHGIDTGQRVEASAIGQHFGAEVTGDDVILQDRCQLVLVFGL